MVLGIRAAELGDEGSDFVEQHDAFLFRFGSESVGAGNPELPKAEAAVEVFGSCLSLSGGKGCAVTR